MSQKGNKEEDSENGSHTNKQEKLKSHRHLGRKRGKTNKKGKGPKNFLWSKRRKQLAFQ